MRVIQCLSQRMTGAFLNALGILLGALFGLAQRTPLSAGTQDFFRRVIGVAAVFFGLRLIWLHVNGTFWQGVKHIFLALAAITLGNWIGRLLRLQKISNQLGRHAGNLIAVAQSKPPPAAKDGFIACTILFCAAPLGWLGAVMDGVAGDYYLLAVKALMDALATSSFIKMFGWLAALSAFPVYVLLGILTMLGQIYAKPFLDTRGLLDSTCVAGGFLACIVALVIFAVRKVELASYLPGLAVAPLLTWLLR